MFLILSFCSAPDATFSPYLVLLCKHSYALSEGKEDNIVDPMILGLPGCCKEHVAGKVTQSERKDLAVNVDKKRPDT